MATGDGSVTSLSRWIPFINMEALGWRQRDGGRVPGESCSVVSDSATQWTIQSMELSRPEYWSE